MDCNEPFAQIFGFGSRADMLAHSAWDFYFDRIEREALIDRLRSRGSCAAEEVCLRGKDGLPVWVLTTRSVASFKEGRPDLLLGTVIDITAQKKARANLLRLAIALIPLIAKRIVSGDLGSTAFALVRAGGVAAGAALAGVSGFAAGVSPAFGGATASGGASSSSTSTVLASSAAPLLPRCLISFARELRVR